MNTQKIKKIAITLMLVLSFATIPSFSNSNAVEAKSKHEKYEKYRKEHYVPVRPVVFVNRYGYGYGRFGGYRGYYGGYRGFRRF